MALRLLLCLALCAGLAVLLAWTEYKRWRTVNLFCWVLSVLVVVTSVVWSGL